MHLLCSFILSQQSFHCWNNLKVRGCHNHFEIFQHLLWLVVSGRHRKEKVQIPSEVADWVGPSSLGHSSVLTCFSPLYSGLNLSEILKNHTNHVPPPTTCGMDVFEVSVFVSCTQGLEVVLNCALACRNHSRKTFGHCKGSSLLDFTSLLDFLARFRLQS